jgi:hypothetical protein
MLTHLWPGTFAVHAEAAARGAYAGPVEVAREEETVHLD